MTDCTDNAESQARAQYETIAAMVAALDVDYDRLQELRDEYATLSENEIRNWPFAGELAELEESANGCTSEEEAIEAIENDPLSVEVRSDWESSADNFTPSEFRVVLCTGGPHVEIVGDLDQYGEPSRPRILFRDWGTSGELFDFDRDIVTRYCVRVVYVA